MATLDASVASPRTGRIFALVLTAALLTALTPIGTGVVAAEDEERIDHARVSQGRSLDRAWCRTCHGEAATGDGPMAEHLKPAPGDLTLLSEKEGDRFDVGRLTAKIDGRERVRGHGSKDMPVWGEAFLVVDEEGGEEAVREKINAVAHYLRSIQASAD